MDSSSERDSRGRTQIDVRTVPSHSAGRSRESAAAPQRERAGRTEAGSGRRPVHPDDLVPGIRGFSYAARLSLFVKVEHTEKTVPAAVLFFLSLPVYNV